jgi:hypothetical protein
VRRTLSIVFAVAPFAAALLRAVQTGRDLRLLWMALAAFVAAAAVTAVAKSRGVTPAVAASVGAFVVATLAAGAAAMLLGATAAPGIWAVAGVFGFCFAVSHTFWSFT